MISRHKSAYIVQLSPQVLDTCTTVLPYIVPLLYDYLRNICNTSRTTVVYVTAKYLLVKIRGHYAAINGDYKFSMTPRGRS